MNATIELTPASLETFLAYAADAGNWGWNPWVSSGNISPTKAQRGNLSDLVKKGLIQIGDSEGRGRARDQYLVFTDSGVELAAAHGVKVVAIKW
jgi:hypothetical protein